MRRTLMFIPLFILLACDPIGGGLHVDSDKASVEPVSHAPIVIYGDSRSGHVTHKHIVNTIISLSPDCVFHAGDVVNIPEYPSDWHMFDSITAELRRAAFFYPARGNHDLGQTWFNLFELPGNELWYEVKVSGIRFLVLDSNSPIAPGSEQHEWLKETLSNQSEKSGLLIAVLHHPIYSSSVRGREDLEKNIVPLFKSYGLDAVIAGHGHNYEHLLVDGIHYVTTGGGGAPLHTLKRKHPNSLAFYSAYHFLGLNLEGDSVHVTAYTPQLRALDSFYIIDY